VRFIWRRVGSDQRKHRVVAIKAAHKLACACDHMLHEDTLFDPTRAFG
jgi:transposase